MEYQFTCKEAEIIANLTTKALDSGADSGELVYLDGSINWNLTGIIEAEKNTILGSRRSGKVLSLTEVDEAENEKVITIKIAD